jgi:hypothetical protein
MKIGVIVRFEQIITWFVWMSGSLLWGFLDGRFDFLMELSLVRAARKNFTLWASESHEKTQQNLSDSQVI